MILNALNANSHLALSGLSRLDTGTTGVSSSPSKESPNSPVPSVILSLSAKAGSASIDSLSRSDAISPVYAKPRVSVVDQAADTASNSRATDQNALDNRNAAQQGSSVADSRSNKEQDSSAADNKSGSSVQELSDQDMQIVESLKARDREVRAHEQAHKSVGGQYAGAISLSYQSGPDGRRYAVGGEVPIDVSPIPGDPEATIVKMTIVKAAATAPAQPSTQDIMVAAEAGRIQMEAQNELLQGNNEELKSSSSTDMANNASGEVDKDVDNTDKNNSRNTSTQTQLGTFQLISGMAS